MQSIKNNINCIGEDNPLNEILFIDFIKKIKANIQDFLSKYQITKFKCANNIFDAILIEYKTFNFDTLLKLDEYLSFYFKFYSIYNLFSILIDDFAKIIEDNKINKNNLNNIYNLMDENINFICLEIGMLNKKIEKNNIEIKKMKENFLKLNKKVDELVKENSKLKYSNSILNRKVEELSCDNKKLYKKVNELKNDINAEKMISNKNKKELAKIKNKLDSISEYLMCPISQEIMNNPVISPSGHIVMMKSN